MVSGVSGGLGEYFRVDPVIFRVLFAVVSFFGGVGLLLYGLCWLLIPEPDVEISVLDRAVSRLRARRVPPWLVIFGGALILWIGWFSWWVPGPAFPALLVAAVLAIVLVNRLGKRGISSEVPDAEQSSAEPGVYGSTGPLIAPLNDTRRSMQEWFVEANEAHRKRLQRRRPIKVAVGLGLVAAWGIIALFDGFGRVPFPAYLWVGLSVLGTGLVASLLTRRTMLSLLLPIAVLSLIAVGLGGTPASLHDGTGEVGWMPTSASQLHDERQFAGESTLDLTKIGTLTSTESVTITQAAGEVLLRLPTTMNATVISDVHLGDVRLGMSHEAGQYASGANVHLEISPQIAAVGPPMTIHVELTLGHIQIDRIS
jgi:phage shock protein PspC (stress-responsive transcriptional regulator)